MNMGLLCLKSSPTPHSPKAAITSLQPSSAVAELIFRHQTKHGRQPGRTQGLVLKIPPCKRPQYQRASDNARWGHRHGTDLAAPRAPENRSSAPG